MIDKKETRTILSENLNMAEKAALMQTTLTPGFKIIIKMANEACLRATQDVAKLNPEDSEYGHKVAERGRRARYISEFSDLLFESIYSHADTVRKQEAQEDKQAEESVGKTFGIHPATPGVSNDAVTKTFGIHPAKPKKQTQK